MKITFNNNDKINGKITLVVEEQDYKEKVEKMLKDYRKKANVPGFRPGTVPMGMVKKQYGTAAKVEIVNQVLGEELYKYINDNKIKMLGEPLKADEQIAQDLENDTEYTFVFDIAIAPEVKVEISDKDNVTFLSIDVDDKLINEQADMFASRMGNTTSAEDYKEESDRLICTLIEQEGKGKDKENGIKVEKTSIMPKYFKNDAQKKLFDGAKLNDKIVFNPSEAYDKNATELAALLQIDKEKTAEMTSDFVCEINEISRYEKAEINQELFDKVYGEGVVKNEEEFKNRIKTDLETQFANDSEYKFMMDVREMLEKKVGEITLPETLLKKVMQQNNPDKEADYVEKNFEGSIRELKWHLIKEEVATQYELKIEENDIVKTAKESAKAQFQAYGMGNVPEEYVEKYAMDMIKKDEYKSGLIERTLDRMVTEKVKDIVKVTDKKVKLEDFNKKIKG